jgi:hypothetical protein
MILEELSIIWEYMAQVRPSLWSSGQSSWLQIQRPGFDSRRYQIFWEVVGLEWGPLSLMCTTEELLERKSSCSDLEIWEYDPASYPVGSGGFLLGAKAARTWSWAITFNWCRAQENTGLYINSPMSSWRNACLVKHRNNFTFIRGVVYKKSKLCGLSPPLVGKVSAKFLQIEDATWSARRIPTALFSDFWARAATNFSKQLLNYNCMLTRLSGPRSRPSTSEKIWQCRESNLGLWICSQKLWPLDHRGGLM